MERLRIGSLSQVFRRRDFGLHRGVQHLFLSGSRNAIEELHVGRLSESIICYIRQQTGPWIPVSWVVPLSAENVE